jgi:peptide/nickel transport system permease protein
MREDVQSGVPERPAVPGRMEAPAIDQLPHSPIPPDEGAAEPITQSLTQRQLAWRRFRRHKPAIVSLVLLILISLAVIFAGVITKYGYATQNFEALRKGPSAAHWFGTDELGRDEFTRVLYGGRISLAVGLCVALSAALIGTLVGSLAGYYGGRLDNLLMRITDLFLSFPFLVILIIGATVLGGSILDIVIVLSLFFWMPDARIVRGVFLSLKEKEFVEAARAAGSSDRRIIMSNLIPNAMGPIIVNVTLSVAAAILTESVLSFLGFGIQPPTPTWGNLLDSAQSQMLVAPWLVWFPGLAILVVVLCVNFLGDGLRDALDPQQQGAKA